MIRFDRTQPTRGGVLPALTALCLTVWAAIVAPVRHPSEAPAARTIAGRTLDQWREVMQQIDFSDPTSAELAPGLTALVQSEDVPWFTRRQAALTLGRMGPLAADAAPTLIELIDAVGDDSETAPQLWAIKAIALYGPVASAATPRLAEVLNDPHAWLPSRLSAVEALSQIARDHPPAVAVLLERLQREPQSQADEELQRAAVEAIGFVGPSASVAVPVMTRMLHHSDANLRREAATALGRLGPVAEPGLAALLECLVTDVDTTVQDAAMTAVGRLGPVVAGDAVASLLDDSDADLQQRVLHILAGWGPAARNWLPLVHPLLEAPSPPLRIAALRAVWRIARRASELAPAAAGLLGQDDRQVRRQAVLLLEEMGPSAEPAREVLERWLHSDRSEVRVAARKALEALQPRARND